MFYLNQFLLVIRRYPIRGSFFILSSLSLILFAAHKQNLEKNFFKSFSKASQSSYFYALISEKENYSRIARKVEALPGVGTVETLKQEQIAKQVSRILSGLKLGFSEDLLDLNYAGLKINFKKGLKVASRNLIREYLVRLAGESNVTLGPIQDFKKIKEEKATSLKKLKKWGPLSIMGLLFAFWGISFILLTQKISSFGYIIEKFQRKNKVSFKITAFGMGATFLFGSILSFSISSPLLLNLMGIFILFAIASSLQLKNWSWKAD